MNKKRIKIWAVAIAAVLTIIIVLQNTKEIETGVLLVSLKMPLSVLLFVTLAVGFLFGLFVQFRLVSRRNDGDRMNSEPPAVRRSDSIAAKGKE